eukprot:TRINITY_DN5626_c0_g1_i4.p1 TRINITY_DN5626_c0_g1~~TRINITY_DN5626_c0_g1_i4.p1  ORF type:complete len:709 (+),score=71.51 TRINITY_DN5626_c0_g1_i4:310-2436(+)
MNSSSIDIKDGSINAASIVLNSQSSLIATRSNINSIISSSDGDVSLDECNITSLVISNGTIVFPSTVNSTYVVIGSFQSYDTIIYPSKNVLFLVGVMSVGTRSNQLNFSISGVRLHVVESILFTNVTLFELDNSTLLIGMNGTFNVGSLSIINLKQTSELHNYGNIYTNTSSPPVPSLLSVLNILNGNIKAFHYHNPIENTTIMCNFIGIFNMDSASLTLNDPSLCINSYFIPNPPRSITSIPLENLNFRKTLLYSSCTPITAVTTNFQDVSIALSNTTMYIYNSLKIYQLKLSVNSLLNLISSLIVSLFTTNTTRGIHCVSTNYCQVTVTDSFNQYNNYVKNVTLLLSNSSKSTFNPNTYGLYEDTSIIAQGDVTFGSEMDYNSTHLTQVEFKSVSGKSFDFTLNGNSYFYQYVRLYSYSNTTTMKNFGNMFVLGLTGLNFTNINFISCATSYIIFGGDPLISSTISIHTNYQNNYNFDGYFALQVGYQNIKPRLLVSLATNVYTKISGRLSSTIYIYNTTTNTIVKSDQQIICLNIAGSGFLLDFSTNYNNVSCGWIPNNYTLCSNELNQDIVSLTVNHSNSNANLDQIGSALSSSLQIPRQDISYTNNVVPPNSTYLYSVTFTITSSSPATSSTTSITSNDNNNILSLVLNNKETIENIFQTSIGDHRLTIESNGRVVSNANIVKRERSLLLIFVINIFILVLLL